MIKNNLHFLKRKVALTLAVIMTFSFVADVRQVGIQKINAAETKVTYGDVNNDGKINVLDMIRMKSYLIENNTKGFSVEAADVDDNGEVTAKDAVELSMCLMNQIGSFSYEMNVDTDGDGLSDYAEKEILGTKYKILDSDADDLDDYSEVYLCGTDPNKPDTNDTGIKDSLKDPDEDGLTNLEEIKLGTSPILLDTDDDGLSDYDEVKKYKTDPVCSNNGKDIIVKQDIKSDSMVLKEINTNNEYSLSLSAISSGNAEKKLKVHDSVFTNYIMNGESKNSVLGKIVDIEYDDTEVLSQIDVMFNLTDESANEYAVFKYYEDINSLLPISTYYTDDNKTAYISNNSTGTYALVNVRKWYNDFNQRTGNTETIQNETNGFELQSVKSGSSNLSENDSKNNSNMYFLFMVDLCFSSNSADIAEEIQQLSEKLFDKYGDNVVIDICCFSYTSGDIMVTPCNELISMDEVNLVLDTLKMYFGINANIMVVSSLMETPLDVALNRYTKNKYGYNYVFTFAPNRYSENIYPDDLLNDLNSISNFHASYVIPSESSIKIKDYVDKYIQNYSGKIFYSNINLDDDIMNFIEYCMTPEDNLTSSKAPYFWNKYYNQIVSQNWFDDSSNNIPDSDNDGINDGFEINKKCIKAFDSSGKAQFKTYEEISKETDDYSRLGSIWMKEYLATMGLDSDGLYNSEMILFHSYPDLRDSDNDGYEDAFDPKPTMQMDSCFELTDKVSEDIFSLINTQYIDIMENPEYGLNSTYNSEKPGVLESAKYQILLTAIQNGGCMVSCIPGAANLFKFITSFNFDYNITLDTMPVAADCLLAYSLNKYTLRQIPLFDASVGGVRAQRFNYYKHMNMMMSCAENVLTSGKTIIIKTKQDAPELAVNYEVDSLVESYEKFKSAEFDWYIAIGGGQNAIVSDIECFENDGMTYYTAKLKYYLFDVYDWQDKAEDMLYNLHKFGMCRSFYEQCYFENTITWKKGARYPRFDDVWSVDVDDVDFTDITDMNLKDAYEKFQKIYLIS